MVEIDLVHEKSWYSSLEGVELMEKMITMSPQNIVCCWNIMIEEYIDCVEGLYIDSKHFILAWSVNIFTAQDIESLNLTKD